MKTGYIAMYGEEKGGIRTRNKGIFLNEDDARKAVKGYGFWGSDGKVIPVNIYESYEDYENNQ